jgi:hypothetical protein
MNTSYALTVIQRYLTGKALPASSTQAEAYPIVKTKKSDN